MINIVLYISEGAAAAAAGLHALRGDALRSRGEPVIRGHLSNATCLTQVFFKSGE